MKYLIMIFLLIYGTSINGQNDIKIMCYNLLNYPEGQMVNRIDTLSKILDYYEPDLLLVQELKSEQGLQNIEEELNSLFGNYRAGTYIPQISNPSNSWRLQQNLIYNETVFQLLNEQAIETPYRDINYFQLQFLNEDTSPSTEIFNIYITHLKSSQGSANEQLRLSMVEVLNEHISLLPPESKIIVAGDFNVYSSSEPAYELLLSPNNGTNSLNDPIDMPGWADFGFSNNEIYTQSTRLSSLDDGSGGGIDDRFDFILLSDQFMNPTEKFVYKEDSYQALGNNGTCYNQDLIDCTTENNLPFELLRSLYYMSDHLPVVLSLEINDWVSTNDLPLNPESQIKEFTPNPAVDYVEIIRSGIEPLDLKVFNLQGKLLIRKTLIEQKTKIDISHFPEGLYLVKTTNEEKGKIERIKLLIQRN